MVRPDKVELVSEVSRSLRDSQSVLLADFKGMTVAQMTDLRVKMRSESIPVQVVKNRLLKLALSEAECDNLDDFLVGNTAVFYGMTDAVAPAKILAECAKKNDKLVIKGGLLEGKRLDAAGVDALSKMPGRQELLTIMAIELKQPAVKLATVMNQSLLKVAYAMNALAEKKEEAA